jgi:Cu(I)/Ag(I) efflux system protein CusF
MNKSILGAACFLVLASIPAVSATGQAHVHAAPESHAAAQAVSAVGVVRKIDAAQSKVVVQHEPIESLGWPGMTMAFRVRDAKLLDGLAPGKKVRFAFVQETGGYVITSIE